ncbi:MAG: hypothetical protein ACRCZP_16310 [Phycicoccus sp.]
MATTADLAYLVRPRWTVGTPTIRRMLIQTVDQHTLGWADLVGRDTWAATVNPGQYRQPGTYPSAEAAARAIADAFGRTLTTDPMPEQQ